MKKIIKIALILIVAVGLILTGCSQSETKETIDNKEEVNTEASAEKVNTPNEDLEEKEEKTSDEEGDEENNNVTENKYIVYVGKTGDEIVELMGKPTEESYSDDTGQYTYYYDKEKITFYLNELNQARITVGFMYSGYKEVLGMKNGMDTKEVISILGMPDEAEESIEGGFYSMYYFDKGGYSIMCSTEGGKEGKIDFITVVSNELAEKITTQQEQLEQQTAEYLAETKSGLGLLEYSTMQENGINYIIGRIENPTDKDIEFVSVSFDIYDSEGNQIEETSDSINKLKSGKTWKFKASVLSEEAARFELNDITNW